MTSETENGTISALKQQIVELQKEKEELQKKVDQLLYTNPVTGLRSRQYLYESIGKSTLPTIFLIDINDFKRYLDLYGSVIGDEMLQMFAEILQAFNADKGYELYHLEGDLFCMLDQSEFIDTPKYEDDLFELMETVLENPLYIPSIDDVFFIDITIGIASGLDSLLNHAFDALNKAKKTKKRYVYYQPFHDMSSEHHEILKIKKEIQHNIEEDNFVPVYQPIANAKGEIIKYEALIRMRKDDELISPAYFLDIAAKTNQYEQISQSTLLKTIEIFKDRSEMISLNFTQADINNKELLREIEHLLQEYAMAKRSVFEIVESDGIDDYTFTHDFVTRFKKLGVKIAIDDFGTGYANFSHIMELEPDYLKIDGSLIKDLQSSKKSFSMVKSIVEFGHELGIKIIAEYVANEEIFKILLSLGVDEFQGFYFGKPEPL
jgi:EAL domain-containing protein (putative c-di-GMP-specific phosphodiesterase class I)/GGDEF domain-containing protein